MKGKIRILKRIIRLLTYTKFRCNVKSLIDMISFFRYVKAIDHPSITMDDDNHFHCEYMTEDKSIYIFIFTGRFGVDYLFINKNDYTDYIEDHGSLEEVRDMAKERLNLPISA